MPGTMKPVNKKSNPGLAKLPQDVRNKMGYMQKGGKATKKYARGGMGSEDEQFFGEEELAEAAKRPTYAELTKLDERDKREMAIQERVREKAKNMTFGEAFKAARKAGKKEFTYKGKRYTAETKEEADKRKARRSQTDTGAADYSSKKKESAKKKEPAKKTGKRDMTKFSQMSFSEQMEYLRTKGKENMGAKTRAAKGGMMKYNKGGLANCGASVKPNGGSRNK